MSAAAHPASVVIRREQDAEFVNRLSNRPEIHSVIARHGRPLDWAPAIECCVILSNGEDAAQVYEQTAPRDWQVITLFADTCRGKRALETGRAMRDWMEPLSDLIFGSIPNGLRHAMWFYRKMGGVPVADIESGGDTYLANDNETLFAWKVAR